MSKQTNHVHKLIAQYLKDNNYPETLKQFENEHGNPIYPSKLLDESLDDIINDRIQYSTLLEKVEAIDVNEELHEDLKQIINQEFSHWITPFPKTPKKLIDIAGLVLGSCYSQGLIYFSTNDSNVHVVKNEIICKTVKMPVVIKNVLSVGDDRIILVGMNGTLYLRHLNTLEPISEVQAHKRLIVDARYIRVNNVDYIVSLGWDFYIRLIKLDDDDNKFTILSELKLQQQGACFDVIEYQNELVIILGKLENTLLDVITIKDNQLIQLYKISLNDAEFTASGFSPRLITIQDADIPLIAVATSHEPFMRLIIVPLLDISSNTPIKRNQIIKNINTMSPQDKYSQPIIAWRLCKDKEDDRASGVWVMGDDGVIRGIDIIDDKVAIELNDGHKGKIKDFISFIDPDGVEKLVTSGVDREIIEWQ